MCIARRLRAKSLKGEMSKVVFTFSSLRSVFRCSAAVRASYGLASNIRKL